MKTTFRFLIMALLLTGPAVSLLSCKKDPDPDPSKGLSANIQGIIPQAALDDLKAKGLVVNEGSQPPDVQGIFLVNPMRLVSPYGPKDSYGVGRIISDNKYRFYDLSGDGVKVDYKSVGGSDTGTGQGAFLSGNGKKFTLFLSSSGSSVGINYKAVKVISGEISADGIVNFQEALTLTEKTGDADDAKLIPINAARVYEDANKLASKVSTY